jgi:APA family basic amino acid/polyamine antiporter
MFSDLHSKFKTPYKANVAILIIVGAFAAFVPGDIVGDMTSIGTLFAFVLVCISVIILRKREPNMKREFRTPWVPFIPILGVLVCLSMMYGLGWPNWLRLFAWMAIGVLIYFIYSKKNSVLNNPEK